MNNKHIPQAIFFDRDGTLIVEEPYLNEPQKVLLEKHVGNTLAALSKKHIPLIVITNQSGIGRGIIQLENLHAIHQKIQSLLTPFQVTLQDFFFCPHHPHKAHGEYLKDCHCRKPKPGMIFDACTQYQLNPKQCFYIGDRLSDMQASAAAGCKSFWVQTGLAKESSLIDMPPGTHVLENMAKLLDYVQ